MREEIKSGQAEVIVASGAKKKRRSGKQNEKIRLGEKKYNIELIIPMNWKQPMGKRDGSTGSEGSPS